MPVRKADARWEGDLPSGKGTMRFGGGAFEGQYSFSSRFEPSGMGTSSMKWQLSMIIRATQKKRMSKPVTSSCVG